MLPPDTIQIYRYDGDINIFHNPFKTPLEHHYVAGPGNSPLGKDADKFSIQKGLNSLLLAISRSIIKRINR